MNLVLESAFDRYVLAGGVMMIGLVPTLILAAAFSIQAWLNLRRKNIAPAGFEDELRRVGEVGGRAAQDELLARSTHSLAVIVREARASLVRRSGIDQETVLRDAIADECDILLQQNSQLALIYRIAPLMGLLGTTIGMITTFNSFAQAAEPDVRELSVGVNTALLTTAWGLFIALPAYVVLFMVQRKIAQYEQLEMLPRVRACVELLSPEAPRP